MDRVLWKGLAAAVTVGVALGVCGCNGEKKDKLEELIEESPFRTDPVEVDDELLLVSCRYYPLRLGGSAEVGSWEWWQEHVAVAGESGAGFSAAQVRLWEENGFLLARAGVSEWGGLREALVAAGGDTGAQTSVLYRRPGEAAWFSAGWIGRAVALGVWEGRAGLRGYTLEPGEAVFRVRCDPAGSKAEAGVRVAVAPAVVGADRGGRVVRRPTGGWERVEEGWQVSFNTLELSGRLGQGEFLAIACGGAGSAETLGSLFLRDNTGEQPVQWIVVLVPEVTTAKALQEAWE